MRAHRIATKHSLKSDKELTQFALFVEQTESMRVTIEEDEDFGDIPEEFLGQCLRVFTFTALFDPNPLQIPSCIRS
jgi:hypothetical protein